MEKNKRKFTFRNVVCYGVGDFGGAAIWSYISTFLMFFYTDVFRIPALTVSLLFLLARLWDGVSDVLLGIAADRTHTRWGRYRPYLLFVPPAGAVLLLLTFWAHPEWSAGAKTAYAYVTYFLVVLAFTSTDVPYGSLPSAITQDPVKRGHLSTARLFFSICASAVLNIFVVPMVESYGAENAQKGYLVVGAMVAVVYCLGYWITFAGVREVGEYPKTETSVNLVQELASCRKNVPFLIAVCGQFLFGFLYYGRNATFMYYFKYVENDIMLMSISAAVTLLPYLFGNLCFPIFFRKVKNKGKVTGIACIGAAVSMALLYFFRVETAPVPFYVLQCVASFFTGMICTGCFAVIPDAVEYGELKTGIRNDAFQYSMASLGNKVGMAISTASFAAILGLIGYVENQAQTPQVLQFIILGFSVIPAALCVVAAVILMRYPITKDNFADILQQLEEKKKAKEA